MLFTLLCFFTLNAISQNRHRNFHHVQAAFMGAGIWSEWGHDYTMRGQVLANKDKLPVKIIINAQYAGDFIIDVASCTKIDKNRYRVKPSRYVYHIDEKHKLPSDEYHYNTPSIIVTKAKSGFGIWMNWGDQRGTAFYMK